MRRPLDDVWTFLTDLQNVPTWDRSIARARLTSAGPLGPDAVVETTSPGGKRQSFRVTAFERPRRLAFRLLRSPMFRSAELIFTLESAASGTRITHDIDLRVRRWLFWLSWILGLLSPGALSTDLDYLRRSLEEGLDVAGLRRSAADGPIA